MFKMIEMVLKLNFDIKYNRPWQVWPNYGDNRNKGVTQFSTFLVEHAHAPQFHVLDGIPA